MQEKDIFNLVQQYINGWKQNDLPMIISCLAENCVVIESHGPTYNGISNIENWFKFWLKAKSKVTKWDILSFYFYEEEQTAFVEWDFACISNNVEYSLPGISIIKFIEQKISFIHEYRMTHQAYVWEKNGLKSE
ncbi:MAG: nuclear transport factor 2 family protein [Gammaproteobacteria bacterium]|nr:nuclear transport factor 2 family protein [Gammaproteobacteria bacterium]